MAHAIEQRTSKLAETRKGFVHNKLQPENRAILAGLKQQGFGIRAMARVPEWPVAVRTASPTPTRQRMTYDQYPEVICMSN